jgi:hypothetical protein
MAIASAEDLPAEVAKNYHSSIADVDSLIKRPTGHAEVEGDGHPRLQCSLVKGIGPIAIPGAKTFGNMILIPDFGVVSLAEVEVTQSWTKDFGGTTYFDLTMLTMKMGSIGEGDAQVARVGLGGDTIHTEGAEEFRPPPPSKSHILDRAETEDSFQVANAGSTRDAIDRSATGLFGQPLASKSSELSKAKNGDAEGTSVTRYPKIDLWVEDHLTKEVLLTIDLALLPDPRTESNIFRVTAPVGWTELQIHTEISSPDLRFIPGQDSGTIVVRNDAPSEPYRVKAWVIGDFKEHAQIEVRATFYYEGRNCGSGRRAFPISQDPHASPSPTVVTSDVALATNRLALETQIQAGKIADEVRAMEMPKESVIPESGREYSPTGFTAGNMIAPFGARPPMLTIEIHLFPRRKRGQQLWRLNPSDRVREECKLPRNLTANIDLGKDEPKYVADLFHVL